MTSTDNLVQAWRLDKLANEKYAAHGIRNAHVIALSDGFLLIVGPQASAEFKTAAGLESFIRDFGSDPLLAEADRAPSR
jgi:hypothetical protein